MENANPYDKAQELSRSIVSNKIFLEYVRAKKEIEGQPEVKEKIMAFRRKQMEVNQAQLLGQTLPDNKAQQLALEYAQLNSKKVVADFFNAEGMFMQMFSEIQQILQKAIESELLDEV